jgi:hypothetical protein
MTNLNIGDGITVKLYTDQHAYTLTEIKGNKVIAQRDKAIRLANPIFNGMHCINSHDIKYNYEQDPNGETIKIRIKKDNTMHVMSQSGYTIMLGRHEYYDYNF